MTKYQAPPVSWENVYIDGKYMASSPPSTFSWNSATVTNGSHTIRADGRNSSGVVGSASVIVTVANGSTPPPAATPTIVPTPAPTASSTPRPSPTPSATATPGHFATLGYRAQLASDSVCANLVNASPMPEVAPWNASFNFPPSSIPASFYTNPTPSKGDTQSVADFAGVTGDFVEPNGGASTDDIIRWAACKHGIDEDIIRAQGMTESHWDQGAAGDKRTSQATCVKGSFTALWNTIIAEPDGSLVSCPNCCFTSWSLWQTKVYYEWTTWPMMMESTQFAADYRYADQRACMNGDSSTYFASAQQQPNTYAADIAAYKAGGPADRVLWGCIGTHYSGGWWNSGAQTYIAGVKNHLALRDWPH